jgi:hypothetical protein
MSAARPYPWTSLVDALGEPRFAAMRAALAAAGTDPFDRDAFVLAPDVGRALRDLVPDEAPAEAVMSYAALLHVLYLHWDAGRPVRGLDRAATTRLLAPPGAPPAASPPTPPPQVGYVQLPERLVWASASPGAAHEPMDGMFVVATERWLRVLAVLGFRPERLGFTTITAEAPLPVGARAARPDRSPPFATVLPAGERMGYFSVTSPAELARLALLALSLPPG